MGKCTSPVTAEHIAWVGLRKRMAAQPEGNKSMNANIKREMDQSWELAVEEENLRLEGME